MDKTPTWTITCHQTPNGQNLTLKNADGSTTLVWGELDEARGDATKLVHAAQDRAENPMTPLSFEQPPTVTSGPTTAEQT